MRLVLHAGLHKTGSTSLQHYLDENREALDELGVIYPLFGTLKNHWPIAGELARRAEGGRPGKRPTYLDELVEKEGAAGTLDSIAELIRTFRGSDRILLISHENLSVPERARSFRDFVASVDPTLVVDVLGYCRNPISQYLSSIPHRIRAGKPIAGPSEWQNSHVRRARALQEVFGDRLTLRGFDRRVLADGDIVADFRGWFETRTGRALPRPGHGFAVNTSLSGAACALVLDRQKQNAQPLESTKAFIARLTAFDMSYAGREMLSMPRRLANVLATRNHGAWNRLVNDLAIEASQRALLRIEKPQREAPGIGQSAIYRWVELHRSPAYEAAFQSFAELKTDEIA